MLDEDGCWWFGVQCVSHPQFNVLFIFVAFNGNISFISFFSKRERRKPSVSLCCAVREHAFKQKSAVRDNILFHTDNGF